MGVSCVYIFVSRKVRKVYTQSTQKFFKIISLQSLRNPSWSLREILIHVSIFIIFKGHIGTPAYEPFLFYLFFETALVIPLGVNFLEWVMGVSCVYIYNF